MVNILLTIGAGASLLGCLSVGVFPMFANCFCKLATVAVKKVLLVVRVALLLTSPAKISFSVMEAFASELK